MFKGEYDEEYEYNIYNVSASIFFYITLFLFECLSLYIQVLFLIIFQLCKIIISYIFTFLYRFK